MKLFDKKRLLPLGLASIMLMFMAPVSSQNNSDGLIAVTGNVYDAALNTPMAGVKVQAYNISRHSAMTKEDGSFTIRIPDYVTSLTFSLDGCNTVVCALKGRTEGITVKMFDENFSEIYQTKTNSKSIAQAEITDLSTDAIVDGQIQQSLLGNILSITRSAGKMARAQSQRLMWLRDTW